MLEYNMSLQNDLKIEFHINELIYRNDYINLMNQFIIHKEISIVVCDEYH